MEENIRLQKIQLKRMKQRQGLDDSDGGSDQDDDDFSENMSTSVSDMSEDLIKESKPVTHSELENLEQRLVAQITKLLGNRGMGPTIHDASAYSADGSQPGGDHSSSYRNHE